MAQAKKKRTRKRRGTQGGSIDARRRAGRPRNREEAKARARSRRSVPVRGNAPPTWRSATIRGIVAAAVFAVLLMLIFGRPLGSALALSAFMLAFYIPAGYYIDQMMWRKRERAAMRAREGK